MSDKHQTATVRVVAKDHANGKAPNGPPDAWKLPFILPVAYGAFVPMAEYLARLRLMTPLLDVLTAPLSALLSGFGFLDAKDASDEGLGIRSKVATVALLFTFVVWFASTIVSVTAQAMGQKLQSPGQGYDNRHPRQKKDALTGIYHRMTAAHQNLIEVFPLFVLVAGMTQILAPNDAHLVELLSVYVFFKGILYMPFYVADFPQLRSLSHSMSTGAALRALTILARRAF